jgi:hypothetical protein
VLEVERGTSWPKSGCRWACHMPGLKRNFGLYQKARPLLSSSMECRSLYQDPTAVTRTLGQPWAEAGQAFRPAAFPGLELDVQALLVEQGAWS